MWIVVFFVLAEILLCCLTVRYWHTWSNSVYTFLATLWQAVVRGLMWLFAFDIMYRSHLITKWTKEQEWKDTLQVVASRGQRNTALLTLMKSLENAYLPHDESVDVFLMNFTYREQGTHMPPHIPFLVPDMESLKNKGSAELLYLMPERARRELEELIARDEPVTIDYEQPQSCYPELPQQE